ncbi:helix-turn-helix transcriptional regulator, partial [Vibrio jasicida]|uniref:helix-turn-helix transcriptional regulator n=1 Tax=Vibrio jasicida TaxID=766224 RepID=UPI0021574E66
YQIAKFPIVIIDMKYRKVIDCKTITLREFYVEHHYIIYLSEAKGLVSINDSKIAITSPTILMIPQYSRVWCDLRSESPTQCIEVQILTVSNHTIDSLIAKVPQRAFGANNNSYAISDNFEIKDRFKILNEGHDTLSNHALKTLLVEESLFFIFLTMSYYEMDIIRMFKSDHYQSKREVITRMISQDPTHKWQIEEVASKLFISSSTLRRHLNKEDVSFSQLLLDVRMGIALNMLTFTSYNVSEISHRCGFGSSAYFCDAFKRKYNLTPSKFRQYSRENNGSSLLTLKY